ncbi:EamA family transporter [Campylobacter sp. FMV-PI01]|uniref:EamA family transporter n=1 Tax=Campylobacter portucalensis TaxID=2608384 RepID=A0A6L5WKY9_9BACT|nr:EamA family transporter [Campylobacter portucalensis]MSN97062.1 EamA family transporter [Campylobacter portucalensis]
MKKLIIVTFIWAFSFSLIGNYLKGVDSSFAALLRVVLALICFLPFMKFRGVDKKLATLTACIGGVQIGAMYLFYYASFKYLSVVEIALFTIFTPFYVTIFYDILNRKFKSLYLISVFIAVFGAFVVKYNEINSGFVMGFLILQGANICFAVGQSSYKFLLEKYDFKAQKELFGYFFVGASFVCLFVFLIYGDFSKLSLNLTQYLVILWLSVVASAVGYFLWNKGACEVDSGVLAIMNNALIPVAIIVNLIFWGSPVNLTKLIIGGVMIYVSLILHDYIMRYYKKIEKI